MPVTADSAIDGHPGGAEPPIDEKEFLFHNL